MPMAEGHCFLFFIYCPALPLPLPCPVSNFPFAARDMRRKLHRERALFFFPFAARDRRRKLHRELFFLLLLGTRGGSYTGNFFSFCCQGQEEEVTQGTFFPFAARDKRRKLHREFFSFCCQGQEEEVTPCTAHSVLP
jgi:hypothetical protein